MPTDTERLDALERLARRKTRYLHRPEVRVDLRSFVFSITCDGCTLREATDSLMAAEREGEGA